MSDNPTLSTFGFCTKCGQHLNVCRGEHAPQPIEEGMTPELEAKAWLREMDAVRDSRGDAWHLTKINKDVSTAELLELYTASQLSAERKWWIERIEQERDKCNLYGEWWEALDDLLTSVRERGGK